MLSLGLFGLVLENVAVVGYHVVDHGGVGGGLDVSWLGLDGQVRGTVEVVSCFLFLVFGMSRGF